MVARRRVGTTRLKWREDGSLVTGRLCGDGKSVRDEEVDGGCGDGEVDGTDGESSHGVNGGLVAPCGGCGEWLCGVNGELVAPCVGTGLVALCGGCESVVTVTGVGTCGVVTGAGVEPCVGGESE